MWKKKSTVFLLPINWKQIRLFPWHRLPHTTISISEVKHTLMLAEMWHQSVLSDCCVRIVLAEETSLSESLREPSGLSVHVRTSFNITVYPTNVMT